jgi:hypothetical protein
MKICLELLLTPRVLLTPSALETNTQIKFSVQAVLDYNTFIQGSYAVHSIWNDVFECSQPMHRLLNIQYVQLWNQFKT